MKKITKEELKTILEQHKLWLDSDGKDGKYAILYGADLSDADLTGVNLYGANLTWANLTGANLYGANLTGANLTRVNLYRADLTYSNLRRANLTGAILTNVNLTDANLTGADLTSANLTRANLRFANLNNVNLYRADLTYSNLRRANLTGADLSRADLTGTDLSRADLTGADLRRANLTDTILDEKEQCRKGIMLTEPMIGYKQSDSGEIITLEIPIFAKVFSINNNKRRTNKCKVIDMQGETELSSWYDTDFKYHVGDEIEITDFDENYNVECSTGIHFFLTREEAENFKI